MPQLPINKRKLLRRHLHAWMCSLAPEEGLGTFQEVEGLIARVLPDPALLRTSGLPATADLVAAWLQDFEPHASRRHAWPPESVIGSAASDQAVRSEIVRFVTDYEILSPKLLRLLRKSPQAMTELLSARYRVANERAKSEAPEHLARLREILSQARDLLDQLEQTPGPDE